LNRLNTFDDDLLERMKRAADYIGRKSNEKLLRAHTRTEFGFLAICILELVMIAYLLGR